jgi:hypothetical protein
MENYKILFVNVMSKVDNRHVRIAILILMLSLFVLGAGAPGAHGDFTG